MSESSEFTIRVYENDAKLFNSAGHVLDWVKSEINAWSWLKQSQRNGQQVFNNFSQYLAPARSAAEQLVTQESNQQFRADLSRALDNLGRRIADGLYLQSDELLSKFVFEEAGRDVDFAAAIAAVAVTSESNNLPSQSLEMHRALIALAAFQMGFSKKGASEAARSLKSTANRYDAAISRVEALGEQKIEKLDDLISQREGKVLQSTQNLAGILSRHSKSTRQEQFELRQQTKDELDSFVAEKREEIDNFVDTLKTELALKAPIEYWKAKRNWHRWTTFGLGLVFLAVTVVELRLLVHYLKLFPGGFIEFLKFWKDAQLGAFGILAALAGIALILTRVIYRLFASQLHLWNDASERVTMIQTYLALSERGHNREEFMGALMGRLFAPASDGVVKDDLGSIGPIDYLTGKAAK